MKFVPRKSRSSFSTTFISTEPLTPDQVAWLEEVFSLRVPELNSLVNESVGYLNGPDSDGLSHLSFYGSRSARFQLLAAIDQHEDKPQE